MIDIPDTMLDEIDLKMKKYKLDQNQDILIAYSGGKDSFFVSVVLKILGYNVFPVILDIGFNAKNVDNNMLKPYGIKAEWIDVNRATKYCSQEDIEKIHSYYDSVLLNINSGKTLCTPCFNAKVIMLNAISNKYEIENVAFGHHGTDAVISLLKSYFMYIDKIEFGHTNFDKKTFFETVTRFISSFEADIKVFKELKIANSISTLMEKGMISTDEPIRQKCGNFYIIRPLFFILEEDIKRIVAKDKMIFPKAECFRSGIRNDLSETPREFIQRVICNNRTTNREILLYLLESVEKSLSVDGQLLYDARRERTRILGAEYENNLQICEKL